MGRRRRARGARAGGAAVGVIRPTNSAGHRGAAHAGLAKLTLGSEIRELYDDHPAERTDALPYWLEAFTHSHLLWGDRSCHRHEARRSRSGDPAAPGGVGTREQVSLCRTAAAADGARDPRRGAPGDPARAEVVYEKSLELTPNRSAALLGLARARAGRGNDAPAAARR